MTDDVPFSERYRFEPRRIVFREDLDDALRQPLIDIVRRSASLKFLQERIDRVFNPYGIDTVPERSGPISATDDEGSDFIPIKRVLLGCPWFRLYDLIEDLYGCLEFHDRELAYPDGEAQAHPFQQAINRYFVHAGIGWQLAHGMVVARGDEGFEFVVESARAALVGSNLPTAAGRVHDALEALSRRPTPDSAGAITHAMGALECVARERTGDRKLTLGEILKAHPGLLPKPLDEALPKIWGYASEQARHVREGRNPNRQTAELVVGLAAAVATYLAKGDRE